MITIHKAEIEDLSTIVPLFDAYRVFYNQPSDISGAETFLKDRIHNNESEIFLAKSEKETVGFVQLYPTFSSVSMEHSYVLNDLYVIPESRNQGVGKLLLNYAQTWIKIKGYKGLALETAIDNPAQRLYEKEGWENDQGYLHYYWTRPKS